MDSKFYHGHPVKPSQSPHPNISTDPERERERERAREREREREREDSWVPDSITLVSTIYLYV